MSDLDEGPALDATLTALGWRSYEDVFGDRAELARDAARRIGEQDNRAHTRGSLLSPILIDLLRRELVHEGRPPLGPATLLDGLAAKLVRCDEPVKVLVRFDVGGDDDAASRIATLLEALGFETSRVSLTSTLTWRIDALAGRCHLTQVERQVLELWIADRNNAQIAAELGFTRQTVKWHTHNLLGKTKAGTRQGLLAMLLGAAASADASTEWPGRCRCRERVECPRHPGGVMVTQPEPVLRLEA
jgi:DNA-binding CsgD family transcriptional regulator